MTKDEFDNWFNNWFNNPTEKMKSDAKSAMTRFALAMDDWSAYGRSPIDDVALFEKSRRYSYRFCERVEKTFGYFNAFQEALHVLSIFGTGCVPQEFQIKGMTESAMRDNFLGQCYGSYLWLVDKNVKPSLED